MNVINCISFPTLLKMIASSRKLVKELLPLVQEFKYLAEEPGYTPESIFYGKYFRRLSKYKSLT